jgi:hypothetical protein
VPLNACLSCQEPSPQAVAQNNTELIFAPRVRADDVIERLTR